MAPAPLPGENRQPVDPERYELLARFVHISDAHVVDEESPGRLTLFSGLSGSAWRAQESYSTQLLDGTIRAVNKIHATRRQIDFLIHTGDSVDNAQFNELAWFIAAFDGREIDPLSGIDDRQAENLPHALLDQHAPFVPQGLYRQGVHGDSPTIPWYSVLGNHDRFGVGVFPIIVDRFGIRVSPLPLLEGRIGFFAPKYLDPVGRISWGIVSPAHPGPPFELAIPLPVEPNPDRRFISDREFVEAHLASTTDPPGHGFSSENPDRTWYSVSPKPGLRLIALNSATPLYEVPSQAYADGAISRAQREFLIEELEKAQAGGEVVVVATHHPSGSLEPTIGTAITPEQFRSILNRYPNVKLHLAGHLHSNNVIDRLGYVEIITGSLIDFPQAGRIVEIWRRRSFSPGAQPVNDAESAVEIRYWFFAHYDEIPQPGRTYDDLFQDAHAALRRVAALLAGVAIEED